MTATLAGVSFRVADPPLTPSGDQGRSLLGRELLSPEYTRDSLIDRALSWLYEQFTSVADRASQASTWVTALAVLVAVVVIAALLLLLSRARWRSRAAPAASPALLDDGLSADELRSRAELALAQGRHEEAVVDGYRAVAVRAIERRRIDDLPGATAHEIAVALSATFGERSEQLRSAAGLFDLVLYGDRSATADQARAVLALDDDPVGVS